VKIEILYLEDNTCASFMSWSLDYDTV